MAGMLPGVHEVSQRKKKRCSYNRQTSSDCCSRREVPHLPSSMNENMNETALRARQRLEHTLGYFDSSFRSSKKEKAESKKSGKNWYCLVKKCKPPRNICAVCLEGFQANQEIMNLSCSHKYHSICLLPWLQQHPNCPYCRAPIKS